MCPVIAGLASFAVGAMQTVSQYQGAKQQADETRRAALADYQQKSTEITRRQVQEEDAANQRTAVQTIEEAQLRSEAEVSAASAGVAGVSLDNLLSDVTRNSARNRETIRENARMTAAQLQLERKGAGATAQSRINSAPKPSGLSLVAGLAGNALSGFNAYDKRMG